MAKFYQIVCTYPVFSPFNDALIGAKARRLPMAYTSKALAQKLAGRMSEESYQNCGDDSFKVVEYDAPIPGLWQWAGREFD
jgi:hypothetical protein